MEPCISPLQNILNMVLARRVNNELLGMKIVRDSLAMRKYLVSRQFRSKGYIFGTLHFRSSEVCATIFGIGRDTVTP